MKMSPTLNKKIMYIFHRIIKLNSQVHYVGFKRSRNKIFLGMFSLVYSYLIVSSKA